MLSHMMEWYDMTDDEREIRDLARDVARDEIAPRATKHDLEGTFVRDSIEELAESGLLGASIPKEYGGLGGSALAATMALEAVSAACGSTGACYLFHLNLCHMIKNSGPEELRQKFLPQLAKDKLGAFAINERVRLFRDPFETTIEEQDGDFVLNGHKPFSTSAGEADITIIQAQRVRTELGVLGQEYVLIEKGMPGISSRIYDPMGLRGASNGSITLENVKVPQENLVGDQPWGMIRAVVVKGRSVLGPNVIAAGIGGAAIEATVDHLMKHGPEEWNSHKLGEMTGRLSALRAYNYYGARIVPLALAGEFDSDMSQAHIEIQWLGGEDGPWICDRAMEIIGGSSFMRSSPIQRYYRDARAASYLAFAMDHRRQVSADTLYARANATEQPPELEWDPVARYSFRMSFAGIRKLPEQARVAFSRPSYEEHARSQGSDEVTLDLYMEHLNSVAARAEERAPAMAVAAFEEGASGDENEI